MKRRRESDEEVRANIPPQLWPLFNRVRRNIAGSDRESRTEAFLRYIEEHPREDIEASERLGEFRLKQVLRPMLDFYETPCWAIRPILRFLPPASRILDPGCGTGAIARELRAAYPDATVTGLEKEEGRYFEAKTALGGCDIRWGDFLLHTARYDMIVSNPPYSIALTFVQHALECAPVVVMLLRLCWLASQKRADWHRAHPAAVYVLPKRPSFTQDGKTDATDYAWFVWGHGAPGTWRILDMSREEAPF